MGVEWNVSKDGFIFTFSDIIETAESSLVTKRNIFKISAMFFDPLGLICPLVLQVKLLFKEACILNVKWDDLLPAEFEVKYNNFIEELRKLPFTSVLRYLFDDQHNVTELELHYTVSVMYPYKHIRLLFMYHHRKMTILLRTY